MQFISLGREIKAQQDRRSRVKRDTDCQTPIKGSCYRLHQQNRYLLSFICPRTVLNAFRNDEHLICSEHGIFPILGAKLNRQLAGENEEKLVGIVMLVPDEASLDFRDSDIIVVEGSNPSG
ncbi:hypothetical protein LshimejAT787_0606120 [Lyophyllum shimeji]|uniref:Uncharacterized protein n=1 Tax=Lyophyllum shimeji TaxID=47721 RepID=A0A9P3PN50_LYOSH|nr:hypothetical protein LshimejAT787_0606120 [Lyophyllum shimeji]